MEKTIHHTLYKVFCIIISEKKFKIVKEKNQGLKNIAPTILDLIELKKPKEMTANSLIQIL